MRLLLALFAGAVALVAAGGGTSAPAVGEARVCAQQEFRFYVQILGNEAWGQHLSTKADLPTKRTVLAVWSLGGDEEDSGLALYGWTARRQFGFRQECTRVRAVTTRPGTLRRAIRVKDGWFYGRKYTCVLPGRIVVDLRNVSGVRRLTVRRERTGELVAVGEVRQGGGWLRASKRCVENER